MNEEMFEKVAKNVGCTVASLKENHQRVLKEQGENLRSAGKADDEVELMCLRVAAQQMRLHQVQNHHQGTWRLSLCQRSLRYLLHQSQWWQ